MQEAYSMLGYAYPYHYSSVFENIQDADMWQEALRSKYHGGPALDWKKHFDSLLGHSAAITDAPAVLFWRELMDAYPDAKIVLVDRDINRWLPSCEVLLTGVLNPFAGYVLRFTDPASVERHLSLRVSMSSEPGSISDDMHHGGRCPLYSFCSGRHRRTCP